MSHWTASQPHHGVRTHHGGREPARRADVRQHPQHAAARAGFTIAHAGHQIRFGPVVFWIAVGTIVIMAGWSMTTATYFAFHDDVLKRLMAREQAEQYAYEDRIADLRAEIERITSRQLLDQDQFEQKLDELVRRQSKLEARASALSGISDPMPTGSIKPGARGGVEPSGKPVPFGDTLFSPRPLDGKQSSIKAKLHTVAASLDRVDRDETAMLDHMQSHYENRVRQLHDVLGSLGLNYRAVPAATGGPFVPVTLPPASQGFARALTRVSIARAEAEDLDRTLTAVPLRKPLAGELEMTSPFGVRIDPFLHQPSMHTGIDFRGNIGDAIYATAAGTVTKAGWDGGYGQMVQIDHGEGLATRYGHMSQIAVTVGQKVRAGQMIGRIGSTGRSTGPHLHYETRVNGEPVNPERFLLAGEKLFGGQIIARAGRGAQD